MPVRYPVFASMIALAGCASTPNVKTDYDQAADFSRYHSYSWVYSGVGTLIIGIYDAATKKPVWHGIATQEVTSDKLDPAKLDARVYAVLARFPPQPGAK